MNRQRPQVQLAETEDLSSDDSVSLPPTNHAGSQVQPIIQRARSSGTTDASTSLRGSRAAGAVGSSSTLGGVVAATVTTETAGTSAPSSQRRSRTPASNGASTRAAGGTRRRQALGGFVWDNPERTGICNCARATALVGILQLAEAHPQGFFGINSQQQSKCLICFQLGYPFSGRWTPWNLYSNSSSDVAASFRCCIASSEGILLSASLKRAIGHRSGGDPCLGT